MGFESINMGVGENQGAPKVGEVREGEGDVEEKIEVTDEVGVEKKETRDSGREEKIRRWEEKEREVEEWADATGKGIDEEIKKSVVAFSMMEFPTSASCEGHLDSGIPAPWVEISAPNEPEEKFIGENKVFEDVAKKYGVLFGEARRGLDFEAEKLYYEEGEISDEEFLRRSDNAWRAWNEADDIIDNLPETEEYKKWRKENEKLKKRVEKLLEEFYRNREVPDNLRLMIKELSRGEIKVHNGGEDYKSVEELTEDQKEGLNKRILEYRKEMEEFAKFLYEKYLLGDEK